MMKVMGRMLVLMAAMGVVCAMWGCSKAEEAPPKEQKVAKPAEEGGGEVVEERVEYPYAVSLADFERLYPPVAEGESAVAAMAAANKVYDGLADAAADKKLPIIGMVEKPTDDKDYPAEMLPVLGAWVANHEELLATYEGIARNKRGGWVRVPEDDGSLVMAHHAGFGNGVRALALQSLARTEMGQLNEAADALEAGFRLSEKLLHEPSLQAHLVAATYASDIVAPQLEWVMAAGEFSEVSLKKLDAALAALEPKRLSDQEIIAGDLVFRMRQLKEWVGSPDKLKAFNEAHRIEMDLDYVKAELTNYSEHTSEFLRAAGRRERRRLRAIEEVAATFPPVPANLAGSTEVVVKLSDGYTLAASHMSDQLVSYRSFLRMRAHLRCVRVAVAVERYRLKYKKLPERLEDLLPKFMRRMARDPLTNKLIKYKLYEGVGYWVYTVKDMPEEGVGEEDKEEDVEDVTFEVMRW
jgi:hypothetical protein